MATRTLKIKVASVFRPALRRSRYKCVYGGRGSGKSHFFATLLIVYALLIPRFEAVVIRAIKADLDKSVFQLIKAKIKEFGLESYFTIFSNKIITPGGGEITFRGLKAFNADSIRSLEDVDVVWLEESHDIQQDALDVLFPTIRKPQSEIWFSYNPRYSTDPVDIYCRQKTPDDMILIRADYMHNPWFYEGTMEKERIHFKAKYPDQYGHVWLGEYKTVHKGAYFTAEFIDITQDGRICKVKPIRHKALWTFHDIGGSGQDSDAYSFWAFQFVDQMVHVLMYYESIGQAPEYHHEHLQQWCIRNKFRHCIIQLPHDGDTDKLNRTWRKVWKSYSEKDHLEYHLMPVSKKLKGAAMARVTAVRQMLPYCLFNQRETVHGVQSLRAYHAKTDPIRNIELGPEHDRHSHAADSFGGGAMRWLALNQNVQVDLKPKDRYKTKKTEDEVSPWV